MAHSKEHPLAHRFVVPHGYLLTGETVRVIDWLDRCGEFMGAEIPPRSAVSIRVDRLRFRGKWGGEEPIAPDQAVAVIERSGSGVWILHASELPSYDPVPVGVIS
ncbi:hypothetical protein MKK84_24600 [Methylobacterium sp. E-065]|uniref:hypothetical protein n=1 Tax=Methylobacterium sp. E-065 TaxID=2836583 RepID=UPI001FB9C9A9|nr:hypothetical protein [Methylobacterium sp. E-065]MCJ2020569.1 hypothetical protein [Methylobacterium sp. E-065]